jgi:hypothetical protein
VTSNKIQTVRQKAIQAACKSARRGDLPGDVRCAPVLNRPDHEVTMESASFISLAFHGHWRTRSATSLRRCTVSYASLGPNP